MIESVKAYAVGDVTFKTLEEAKLFVLTRLLEDSPALESAIKGTSDSIAEFLMDNADKVIDILSTGPRSKPKARAINGGKKPRKAKPEPPRPTNSWSEPENAPEERPHVKACKV